MTTSTFTHARRRQFTPQERAKFFEAAGGRCARCTRRIGAGEDWDLDHRVALECGGTNDDENMQVLCPFCHSGKTSADHGLAAKGRRVMTKHTVPSKYRKGRGWR